MGHSLSKALCDPEDDKIVRIVFNKLDKSHSGNLVDDEINELKTQLVSCIKQDFCKDEGIRALEILEQFLVDKQKISFGEFQDLLIKEHKLLYSIQQGYSSWAAMPKDVLLLVFQRLPPMDLGKCLSVCTWWKRIAETNSLWKNIAQNLKVVKTGYSSYEQGTLLFIDLVSLMLSYCSQICVGWWSFERR